MSCLLDEQIQEYIDHESAEPEAVAAHLKACPACRERYRVILAADQTAMSVLSGYRESVGKSVDRRLNHKKGVLKPVSIKKIAAVACLVVVLSSLAFEPVRVALANSLNIFRAGQTQSVDITVDDLNSLSQQISKIMSQEGINNISDSKLGKFTCDSGATRQVTADEAKGMADYPAKLPDIDGVAPTVTVSEKSSIKYTPSVKEVNSILKKVGMSELLPDDVDGKEIVLNLPLTIDAQYQLGDSKYLSVNQSKVPELLVPDGVDYDKLYNAVLDLPIIPDNIRQQLSGIKDWKNTVPVPVGDGAMEETGINGTTVYVRADNYSSYVAFIKDDVVCMLSGNVTKQEIIDYAKLFI